jgi:hypothetical protein
LSGREDECPKCGKKFDSVEHVKMGPRTFARYSHRIGTSESIFVQTCYVRVSSDQDSKIAESLSEKEDFLEPDEPYKESSA